MHHVAALDYPAAPKVETRPNPYLNPTRQARLRYYQGRPAQRKPTREVRDRIYANRNHYPFSPYPSIALALPSHARGSDLYPSHILLILSQALTLGETPTLSVSLTLTPTLCLISQDLLTVLRRGHEPYLEPEPSHQP